LDILFAEITFLKQVKRICITQTKNQDMGKGNQGEEDLIVASELQPGHSRRFIEKLKQGKSSKNERLPQNPMQLHHGGEGAYNLIGEALNQFSARKVDR
jgi:hypothetical protein